jgi:hypothetical protein
MLSYYKIKIMQRVSFSYWSLIKGCHQTMLVEAQHTLSTPCVLCYNKCEWNLCKNLLDFLKCNLRPCYRQRAIYFMRNNNGCYISSMGFPFFVKLTMLTIPPTNLFCKACCSLLPYCFLALATQGFEITCCYT